MSVSVLWVRRVTKPLLSLISRSTSTQISADFFSGTVTTGLPRLSSSRCWSLQRLQFSASQTCSTTPQLLSLQPTSSLICSLLCTRSMWRGTVSTTCLSKLFPSAGISTPNTSFPSKWVTTTSGLEISQLSTGCAPSFCGSLGTTTPPQLLSLCHSTHSAKLLMQTASKSACGPLEWWSTSCVCSYATSSSLPSSVILTVPSSSLVVSFGCNGSLSALVSMRPLRLTQCTRRSGRICSDSNSSPPSLSRSFWCCCLLSSTDEWWHSLCSPSSIMLEIKY